MKKKLLGKTMDDHLANVARRLPNGQVMAMRDVEVDATFIAKDAMLQYRSGTDSIHPNRPYLHLIGECRSLTGDLPFDIHSIEFDEDAGIPVDVFYEFTNDELANMTKKGLFDYNFEIPDILIDNLMEIPVFANLAIVKPEITDDVPIVFADIKDRKQIQISEETSGYTFGDYFEDPSVPFDKSKAREAELLEEIDVHEYFKPDTKLIGDESLVQEPVEVPEEPVVIPEPTVEEKADSEVAHHVANVERRVLDRLVKGRSDDESTVDDKGEKSDKPDSRDLPTYMVDMLDESDRDDKSDWIDVEDTL